MIIHLEDFLLRIGNDSWHLAKFEVEGGCAPHHLGLFACFEHFGIFETICAFCNYIFNLIVIKDISSHTTSGHCRY